MRHPLAAMALCTLALATACGGSVDAGDDLTGQSDHADEYEPIPIEVHGLAAGLVIYDDAVRNGFEDWSWGGHGFAQSNPVRSGKSIYFDADYWNGLFLHHTPITRSQYTNLDFYVHGGSGNNQKMDVVLYNGTTVAGRVSLARYAAVKAGTWVRATIPLTAFGNVASFDGLAIVDMSGADQARVYFDDMLLTSSGSTPPTPPPTSSADVTVSVDRALDRKNVNPEVYGVNFGSNAAMQTMKYPVRRWGGNHTSRYNWENDTANRGSDWFFLNVAESNANPSLLPNGSATDVFVDEARAAGANAIITVPLMGWTPVDRDKRAGFSVAKYGAQQQTECTASGNASWCTADAGNGVRTNGTLITGTPTDTSKAIDASFVTRWIQHFQGRVGAAQNGGVRYYALDNEPTLWNQAHRDVHPNGLTYDELWQKTVTYGKAVKAADPQAKTLGPAEWGWCGYVDSTGGCGQSQDRKNHGDLPMLAWYLKQVCDEQARSGVRVVDYLDVHFYPQQANVSLSSDESAATQALRLRSVKALYDASYVDESWIAQPVRLIPRMKEWIASYCPGTKLAITEYHFGNDNGITAALAQAETLAIFAREGVDLATRWIAPEQNTLVEDAFKLFLSYDGAGARVLGTSVRAVTTNVDMVAGYAIEASNGVMQVVLVNHDTAAHSVRVNLAGATSATLYGFENGKRIGARGTAAGDGNGVTLQLPARSATLARLQ